MRAPLHLFWSTIEVHLKNTLARPMFQVVLIVQPFVVATTAYMVFRDAGIEEFAAFVVLGGGLAGIWSALTFSSAGDINRERFYGTLEPMLASPSALSLIFSAKIAANGLLSLLALAISLLYSWALLGVTIQVVHAWAFFMALGAFLLASNAFALALSTLFLLSRSTAIMQNFLEYPLLLLGGLAFPVTILPGWVQVVSSLVPMRWGSEALRLSLGNELIGSTFWVSFGLTLFSGLAYYLIALILFRRIEQRVRRDATLELA